MELKEKVIQIIAGLAQKQVRQDDWNSLLLSLILGLADNKNTSDADIQAVKDETIKSFITKSTLNAELLANLAEIYKLFASETATETTAETKKAPEAKKKAAKKPAAEPAKPVAPIKEVVETASTPLFEDNDDEDDELSSQLDYMSDEE